MEYYLPIYLSKKQKEGLENAIRYEVSYIQGPPGTGKSHVITALALLSILKGYKVLIVSQKAPAIKVLYEKLMESLGRETIIYHLSITMTITKESLKSTFPS